MNFDGDISPSGGGDKLTTNVQPVIPFDLGEDWSLITRTIIPLVHQDDVIPGDFTFGLGEINLDARAPAPEALKRPPCPAPP